MTMREVTTHHIDNLPEEYAKDLRVYVGPPDEHGVPHQYELRGEPETNILGDCYGARVVNMPFQHGDPRKGWNGGTSLAYVAAIRDFLVQCQASKFACDDNTQAITHLDQVIALLQQRIRRRVAAGTFQTHQAEKP